MTDIAADSPTTYENWKAPADDGTVLIWPAAAELMRATAANQKLLNSADAIRIQNVPLPELRSSLRLWIGHTDKSRPMLGTGHQTELYHAGVWAKDALLHALAEKIEGAAYHFAVDTDQPKHLDLRWPGTALPLTDDPTVNSAEWSGLLAMPTPSHIAHLDKSLGTAAQTWAFEPVTRRLLSCLKRISLEPVGLAAALTNAQHELDWELGLRYHAMVISPILSSQPYLALVHHILSQPEQFATDYNASLGEYRLDVGINSPTRPMPDLRVTTDRTEVPFWFDRLSDGSRSRAEVIRLNGVWVLRASETDADFFRFDPAIDANSAAEQLNKWLRQRQLRLAPRALALTLFLRLLVVDLFVHGIGGGRYDQVTDRLISRHFKLVPPRFAVTTATLLFPEAVGRSRVCINCLLQEKHRLKHGLLGESKARIVSEIDRLPRGSVQRSLAFHNMHAALAAASIDSPALEDFNFRQREALQRDRDDQIIFDRELSYTIQSRERLTAMIDRFKSAMV